MQTKAAVIGGKNDIYLREFTLPKINHDELLVKVISNSICLSTYKAALLGEDHKRVPNDIKNNPVMTGHEFAGIIIEVGDHLKDQFKVNQKFVLQPAMGLESGYSAGYSYPTFGGNTHYCIIPKIAIDLGCVLLYEGTYFANASLAEPMSCNIGAFHASYHTKQYVYTHDMGIKSGGNLALLGCAGPMGVGAIDYAINGPYKPKLIVVTDIDDDRLTRAASLLTVEDAATKGIELHYVNTRHPEALQHLIDLSKGRLYDDVFVYAASQHLLEQADELLGHDGCLNFFAGPTDKNFKVPFNFYKVHYESTHVVGTSGGSTDDMRESLHLSAQGIINPSYMITHVGGLNVVPDTILNLPNIPGGKKLIYPHIEMDLVAINDFETRGEHEPLFAKLAKICKQNNNVWCEEAERALLQHFNVSF